MKTFAAAVLLALGLAGAANAQYRPGYPGGYGGGSGRPTTSPYLNLVGRGNPAVNYYGIVRPQFAMENAVFGGVGTTGGVEAAEEMTDPILRRPTGHAVMFNNLSHYYFNNPAVPNQGPRGGVGAIGAPQFNNTVGGLGATGAWQTGNQGRSFGGYGTRGYGTSNGLPGTYGGIR